MCSHDPMFKISNEAAGGIGCPRCNSERRAKRVVMVSRNGEAKYDQAFYDGIIAARLADEASAEPQYEPISRLMYIADQDRGLGMAGNEPERCEAGGFG